MKVGNTTV